MQIIAVVAFGNGREAYPSQHKSQVRCQWDNLTWKILLCPRTCVSALQVSCSPVLTGCACLLLPSCFHLHFKYGFTTYFHLSLAWLLWLLSHGKGERGLFQRARGLGWFCLTSLPLLAAVTRGHCVCEHRFVFHHADTVYWQSPTAYKLLCAATRIASALKTNFGIRRIEFKKTL